ncbi:ABC transporter substrate-binding protein [Streptomyces sp. NPDC054962]
MEMNQRQIGLARTSIRRKTAAAASVALAVLAAGCSGADGPESDATSNPVVPVREGGSLVIGAEQEPDCADWIAVCGSSIWGGYMMQTTTIPTVFDVRRKGSGWAPVASNLMAEEPKIISVGEQQQITYKIAADAVWSDGEPITSSDLAYTALQIRDGKDIFAKTGYDQIVSVATPDAKTAVVTLKRPYGGWRALFSSSYGVLPKHLLEGKNRNALMKDGYTFSGGPWKIQSWKRGVSVTLVPNKRYWGKKPKLDRVTFQFTADTAAAFQAFRSGQLDALYPSPQLDVLEQLKRGAADTKREVESKTGNLEALWLNNGKFPFDAEPVRKAVAYAIDRSAIVKKLYGPLGVEEPAQSFLTPVVSQDAGESFSKYTRNLGTVDKTMKDAGWAKDESGIWTKGGRRASFTIVSLAGNKRRELTEQVLQAQLKEAGFSLAIKNTSAAELFGKKAPAGDFQMGLWTLVDTFPSPALSSTFSSSSIPTAANGQSGLNFIRARVDGLDPLLSDVDTETDEQQRKYASLRADRLIADAMISLPLSTVPNILLWNKKIGGPISINPSEGPWWNLEEWGVAR